MGCLTKLSYHAFSSVPPHLQGTEQYSNISGVVRFTKPACNCTGMMCDGLGQCFSSTEQRSTWSCAAALIHQGLHLLSDLAFSPPPVIVEQLATARNLDGLNNHLPCPAENHVQYYSQF